MDNRRMRIGQTWRPAFWLRVCIVLGAVPAAPCVGAPDLDFPPVDLGAMGGSVWINKDAKVAVRGRVASLFRVGDSVLFVECDGTCSTCCDVMFCRFYYTTERIGSNVQKMRRSISLAVRYMMLEHAEAIAAWFNSQDVMNKIHSRHSHRIRLLNTTPEAMCLTQQYLQWW